MSKIDNINKIDGKYTLIEEIDLLHEKNRPESDEGKLSHRRIDFKNRPKKAK